MHWVRIVDVEGEVEGLKWMPGLREWKVSYTQASLRLKICLSCHLYMCMKIYICVYTFMEVCMYACVHDFIRTLTHARTHTHTHTHTHTQVPDRQDASVTYASFDDVSPSRTDLQRAAALRQRDLAGDAGGAGGEVEVEVRRGLTAGMFAPAAEEAGRCGVDLSKALRILPHHQVRRCDVSVAVISGAFVSHTTTCSSDTSAAYVLCMGVQHIRGTSVSDKSRTTRTRAVFLWQSSRSAPRCPLISRNFWTHRRGSRPRRSSASASAAASSPGAKLAEAAARKTRQTASWGCWTLRTGLRSWRRCVTSLGLARTFQRSSSSAPRLVRRAIRRRCAT